MRRRVRCFIRLMVFFLVLALLAFFMLRSRYRDVIRELAETQVKNTTSDLTNDAIAEQIADGIIQYDRIVYFEKDLDGRITALKTNMSEVNRLKTDILNIINDEILALDTSDIGIPLGSLFLPEFLSGKGPAIPVHILSIRNSDANFVSDFTQYWQIILGLVVGGVIAAPFAAWLTKKLPIKPLLGIVGSVIIILNVWNLIHWFMG